jgi:hypothetical protein
MRGPRHLPDESGHAREDCPAMSSADLAAGAPHPCAVAHRATIMHFDVDPETLTGRVTGASLKREHMKWRR